MGDLFPAFTFAFFAFCTGSDDAYFLTSTSLPTNLFLKAGTGELDFLDQVADPVARLKPVKVNAALYGTLDDLYLESIRVLKDLK